MVIYQLGSIRRHGHPANLNLPACRPQPAILHPCIPFTYTLWENQHNILKNNKKNTIGNQLKLPIFHKLFETQILIKSETKTALFVFAKGFSIFISLKVTEYQITDNVNKGK